MISTGAGPSWEIAAAGASSSSSLLVTRPKGTAHRGGVHCDSVTSDAAFVTQPVAFQLPNSTMPRLRRLLVRPRGLIWTFGKTHAVVR